MKAIGHQIRFVTYFIVNATVNSSILQYILQFRFLRRLEQALKERDKAQLVSDVNDESDGTDSPQTSSPLLVQRHKSSQNRFSRQKKVANLNLDEPDRNRNVSYKDYLSD